jgi:hypothetical protein
MPHASMPHSHITHFSEPSPAQPSTTHLVDARKLATREGLPCTTASSERGDEPSCGRPATSPLPRVLLLLRLVPLSEVAAAAIAR